MIQYQVIDLEQVDDGFGGFEETEQVIFEGTGYLDMLTASDRNSVQYAAVEQSTHVLIVDYSTELEALLTNDKKIVIKNKTYFVTHTDNPVNVNHHLEVYLSFGDSNG